MGIESRSFIGSFKLLRGSPNLPRRPRTHAHEVRTFPGSGTLDAMFFRGRAGKCIHGRLESGLGARSTMGLPRNTGRWSHSVCAGFAGPGKRACS